MMFDELVDACNRPSDWPVNLLDKRHLRSKLEQGRSLLIQEHKRLFIEEPQPAWVHIHEIYTGGKDVERNKISNQSELDLHYRKHLCSKEKDPRMRHVFLTAEHSAAPLDCTMKMFQYLCSYHQISPDLLELICSFGSQSEKMNFHHMHILHQISDNTPYFNMAMPEIGRSGKELRVAYKLFAMEQQERELQNKWVMRQTATYHTLDLVKWKALWVTVKANDLIQDRVAEANATRCGSATLSPSAEAISRSLAIHQVMFDWCTDGWGWYINKIANDVEDILTPTTGALIPNEQDSLDPSVGLMKSLTSLSSSTEIEGIKTMDKKSPSVRPGISTIPSLHNMISQGGDTSAVLPAATFGQDLEPQIKITRDRLNVLKKFSFGRVRQLDILCNKLKNARTAITANMSVALEISEIYKRLLESLMRTSEEENKISIEAIRQFQDYLRMIAHNLESDRLRIDHTVEKMNDGKSLYYHILDLQRTELDKLYSMNQHASAWQMQVSSRRMEDVTNKMHSIAKRTERDTSSMHFITFLTLVFLPGTFLGSLFSTPIINESDKGSILNSGVLFLFLEICLPMMFTFIVLWFAYRRWKHGREKKEMDEKSGAWV
ncbi:hypothetical protein PG985_016105 [Apiospora marii]|uniref:CorA-like transporter domain-containing protein n=1 Tax=Apiospora marii TaxID=335849 RepID=A0ABR1S3J2_9PEZI